MHKGETQAKTSQNPSDLFAFDQETRIQCVACKTVRYQKQRQEMLIVRAPVSAKCEPGTPVEFEDCLQHYFAESFIEDFACGVCNKKTVCSRIVRFATYPTVLVAVLAREVYDDWVPKKLEIDLKMTEGPIDFERFKATGIQEGEFEMPQVDEYEEPELNKEMVAMLVDMGIPESAAKHACYNTQC